MTKVYVITKNYSDLEHHVDELTSLFVYESKEEALEEALHLSNQTSFYEYDVVELEIKKGGKNA